MAYFYGLVLFICATIDRRHGDGAVSANIELSAGFICMAIGSIKPERAR